MLHQCMSPIMPGLDANDTIFIVDAATGARHWQRRLEGGAHTPCARRVIRLRVVVRHGMEHADLSRHASVTISGSGSSVGPDLAAGIMFF